MYVKNFKAKEVTDVSREITYPVAVEDTIELFVNRTHVASILATPEMLEELAVGYLICEGAVRSMEEIRELRIDGRTIHAGIEQGEHLELWRELRSSGCVGARWDENETVLVSSNTVFKMEAVRKSLAFLDSSVYRKTRGTHAACLVNAEGKCVIKAIDVGRHNAFDKVVGKAYIDGIDVSRHFLLSTGRQSAGMVMKAARAGIPLVATKTAPLSTGIEAAQRSGVCLACFVSQDRISVFAHPERLQ